MLRIPLVTASFFAFLKITNMEFNILVNSIHEEAKVWVIKMALTELDTAYRQQILLSLHSDYLISLRNVSLPK